MDTRTIYMQVGRLLFSFLLIFTLTANANDIDTLNVSAFTYVSSDNGDNIGLILAARTSATDYLDGLEILPEGSGTPAVYSMQKQCLDTIRTMHSLAYETNKDGMAWCRDNETLIFDKFIYKNGRLEQFIYKNDKIPKIHWLSQTLKISDTLLVYWMGYGFESSYYLIVNKNMVVDTIDQYTPVESDTIITPYFYKLYFAENGIVYGRKYSKQNKSVICFYDLNSMAKKSIDTSDNCFYRLEGKNIYYKKNGSLVSYNIISNCKKVEIDSVNGEFDVSERGIVFSRNYELYFKEKSTGVIKVLGIRGISPRWMGNTKKVLFSCVDRKSVIRLCVLKLGL